MNFRRLSTAGIAFFLALFCLVPSIPGQVSVLTQHNDNARTGQNLNETQLNTSNVTAATFGKLFSRNVDGYIYAQPLFVPSLIIGGKSRNVVFVATQHNSVYAFDADDPAAGAPLWQTNLGPSVPSTDICSAINDPINCPYLDIIPEIGITSTPVIDGPGYTIFVLAKTKNSQDGTHHFYLHALDLLTGNEKPNSPVEVSGQVSGSGAGSANGVLTFNPFLQNQRPGLLLANGMIYAAFGSVGDIGNFHGWVFSFNAATLQQAAIFCTTPNGHEGGIWQAGQGLIELSGNIFLMTGDGMFDAGTGGTDYGDSFIKLSSSLDISDYFTPSNQGTLDNSNIDLGSGGPLSIPGTSLIIGIGKDGILRVVDTLNMGKYNSGFNADVQEFSATTTAFMGAPIYWDSPNYGPLVYMWGRADYLKAYAFSGTFQTAPVMKSTIQGAAGYSNSIPLSLSANGSQSGSGIVWAAAPYAGSSTSNTVPGLLRAFDAADLTKELWNSLQNPSRDDLGNYAKFCPPTIANGKVYVPTFSGQLVVYGLLSSPGPSINFVQVAAATPQSPTSTVRVSYTNSQNAGNFNIVVVGWNDTSSTVQSVGDSAGNRYTLAAGPIQGTNLSQSIYYAPSITGGPNSVTVTFSQAALYPDIRILEYSGIDTINPLDATAGSFGSGSTASAGAVTTTLASELVFAANTVSTGNRAPIAPFVARIITYPDSDIAQDIIVSAIGTYTGSAQLTAAGPWVMQIVSFRGASSSGGGGSAAPQIADISPNSGAIGGGTSVTISGSNFLSGATVRVGANAATAVSVLSETSIAAVTPSGPAGAADVTVTNQDGLSDTLAAGFVYVSPPAITGISPGTGSTAGGTNVAISGTGFAAGATVKFGSNSASSVNVISTTSITATTPPGAVGPVSVTVTNANGLSGTLAAGYSYTGAASISFVQVAAATPQSPVSNIVVSYPVAQRIGDMNIVVVGWNDTLASVQSVSDSAGNSYLLAVGPTLGSNLSQSIYYAPNIAGGTNAVTVTFSGAAAYADIRVLEYQGITALDSAAGASGSGSVSNSGAVTTTAANALILGANTVTSFTSGPGAGFLSRIITRPDGDIAEDAIVSATGSYSATANLSPSGFWVMQIAAFK